MQAFTPFVRVDTDAARHFATFGLAPAAAQVLWCLVRAEEQGDDEDDEDEEEKIQKSFKDDEVTTPHQELRPPDLRGHPPPSPEWWAPS